MKTMGVTTTKGTFQTVAQCWADVKKRAIKLQRKNEAYIFMMEILKHD